MSAAGARWVPSLVLGAVIALGWCGTAAAAAPAPDSLGTECDYGVMLALQGRLAAAESVFTSLLTHSPGDPRALVNLGNINLLEGDRSTALAFYRLAEAADTADAGIKYDRATTLYLMHDDSKALEVFAQAQSLARATHSPPALFSEDPGREEAGKAADMSMPLRFPLKPHAEGRAEVSLGELRALAANTGDTPKPRAEIGRPIRVPLGKGGAGINATPISGDPSKSRPPRAAADTSRHETFALAEPREGSAADRGNAAAALYWKR